MIYWNLAIAGGRYFGNCINQFRRESERKFRYRISQFPLGYVPADRNEEGGEAVLPGGVGEGGLLPPLRRLQVVGVQGARGAVK